MKITYLNPAALIPYEKNSKDHPERQIAELAAAIETFGFDQPIVVDKHGVIIKGHGRHLAALRLKLTEVPVVVRDISAHEAVFLRVADNESARGDWDTHALKQEMKELAGSGFDLNLTGFELEERELILSDLPSKGAGDIEISALKTTHECGKCGYKW